MRIITKIAILSTLVLAGLSVQAAAQAQVMTPRMVGGYEDASPREKNIRAAAVAAIREHAKREHDSVILVKINKAEKQVLSGMNYRLCMDVRRGRRGRVHTVTAVVYKPIRKPMRLTNWEEGGCKDL